MCKDIRKGKRRKGESMSSGEGRKGGEYYLVCKGKEGEVSKGKGR